MLVGHVPKCRCEVCERLKNLQKQADKNLEKANAIRIEELDTRLRKLELQFEIERVKHDIS